MFKTISSVETKPEVLLKSKELKHLYNTVINNYVIDNHQPKEITARIQDAFKFLLDKHIGINTVKLVSSRTLLYTLTSDNNINYCVFFDIDNRKCQLYPSLYTLWNTIHIDYSLVLPTIIINEEVSYYILNGADLMHPGIIYVDNNITIGCMVAIRVKNNPLPFAIGKRVF